jgi:hypothetical protein
VKAHCAGKGHDLEARDFVRSQPGSPERPAFVETRRSVPPGESPSKCKTVPLVVSCPIALPPDSASHNAPSGPSVISRELRGFFPSATEISVILLSVGMRRILSDCSSVNHIAPSGHGAMPKRPASTTQRSYDTGLTKSFYLIRAIAIIAKDFTTMFAKVWRG